MIQVHGKHSMSWYSLAGIYKVVSKGVVTRFLQRVSLLLYMKLVKTTGIRPFLTSRQYNYLF